MSTIKVAIVDDHPLMLEGIRAALDAATDIKIVCEASDGAAVLPLVLRHRPDVVLLDVRLPKLDGLACLEILRRRQPDVKVVVLSMFSDPEHIHAALVRGACGYVVKSINPLDLPSAVRQAFEGTVFHVAGVRTPATEASRHGLTERELAILEGLVRGRANRALAKELWVTEQTVKFHLTNIYRKLGVANRTEAARAAYRLGVVESPLLDPDAPHGAGRPLAPTAA